MDLEDSDGTNDEPAILAICEVKRALCNAYSPGGEWLEEGKHPSRTGGWRVVGSRRSSVRWRRRLDGVIWGCLGHSRLYCSWHATWACLCCGEEWPTPALSSSPVQSCPARDGRGAPSKPELRSKRARGPLPLRGPVRRRAGTTNGAWLSLAHSHSDHSHSHSLSPSTNLPVVPDSQATVRVRAETLDSSPRPMQLSERARAANAPAPDSADYAHRLSRE